MGFYGNITNTSKTQFQFDKIYSNRVEMERNLLKDNIYIGRYVLIEYDNDIQRDDILRVYTTDEITFYLDSSKNTKLTKGQIGRNELAYTYDDNNTYIYYQCVSDYVAGSSQPAQFERVDITTNSNYTRNYNIDLSVYNSGRGYDSTVWQKVYTNNSEKYVMIAELNSVVPTFTVVADPPTMNPIAPHFDAESTDVYYKLHWQTPWGFRIAAATDANKSDEITEWTTTTYNPETGKNETNTSDFKDAAIFFNKAGFNPDIRKKVNDTDNFIKIIPVSSEQEIYNDHNNPGNLIQAPDIQEMSINLPAIGNMMSDAWDIIHGPNRDNARTDKNGSLQGRLDSFKDMAADEIPVKRGEDGTLIGATINGGKTSESDLTGKNDDAWIETMVNGDIESITIKHTFNKVDDTESDKNVNDDKSDTIDLYTPHVDATGHVVGKNIQTIILPYGFKTIKTNGRGESIAENANGAPVTADIIADNTQDVLTINSGNKWIRIDTNSENDSLTISHDIHDTSNDESTTDWTTTEENTTIPVVNYNYDNAGHYVSHHTENYKLPFGYGKIKGDNDTVTAATATYDELTFGSDDWLTATIEKDKVIYSHDYPKEQEDTESSFDMNSGINNNTIILETLTHDDKGHIVNVNQHTVTLPYGYKEFRDSNIEVGQSIANNTQDVFVFKGDTWIKPTVSTDLATFTHIGPVSGTHTSKINNEPKFGETFVIEDHYFDDKGHKYSTETHTVLLPKGSLNDNSANGADVITQLAFIDTTGALSSTRTNISKLLLTGYEKKADNSDIAETDTLDSALSKLQTQIHDEETARANANTVLQESLKDEITRAKTAEEQVLTDAKAYTDQVKKAILTGESADILGETYDTLLEISNWINGDGVNTTELIDAIAVESNRAKEAEANLGTLITNEATNRENAIKASIESLDVEDFAINGEYISSVSQIDGKIKIERKSLPVYTLVESDTNGSINFNGTDIPVHGLGSVAYESVDLFVKVEDFNAAIAEKDQEIYTLNSRCNTLDTEVKNLINLVKDLTTRITKLEEQNNTVE